jgi:hypothetical protein
VNASQLPGPALMISTGVGSHHAVKLRLAADTGHA